MASASISISHSGNDRPLTTIHDDGGGSDEALPQRLRDHLLVFTRRFADIDAQHDDLIDPSARGGEHALDVVQRGLGLFLQARSHGALVDVDADLPRQQHAAAAGNDHGLAEAVLHRVEYGVGIDHGSGHIVLLTITRPRGAHARNSICVGAPLRPPKTRQRHAPQGAGQHDGQHRRARADRGAETRADAMHIHQPARQRGARRHAGEQAGDQPGQAFGQAMRGRGRLRHAHGDDHGRGERHARRQYRQRQAQQVVDPQQRQRGGRRHRAGDGQHARQGMDRRIAPNASPARQEPSAYTDSTMLAPAGTP